MLGWSRERRKGEPGREMRGPRVIIVGAGLSGTAVVAHLARLGRATPEIVLIEQGRRFGPGLAYGGGDPEHALNVRAARLSLFSDRPDDFARWLKSSGDVFAPRAAYGRYLERELRTACRAHWPRGPKLMRGEVVACTREGLGWRVCLANGRSVDGDAVVLALGNPAPKPLTVLDAAGVTAIGPWDAQALRRAPAGDALLIGAGLTMVDVALSLARRKRGLIYALSTRGLLPRAHADAGPAQEGFDVPVQLSAALHRVRALAREAQARGEPWQWTIERLRAQTPTLWRRLDATQQARFLRHARSWWDVHRHRGAPEVMARIDALRAEGRLRVLAGEMVSAAKHKRGVEIQHRQRGSHARHRLEVAFVVNCTGADLDPRRSASPLVRQMLADGIARAHPSGLGFDVDAEGALIDAEGASHPALFTLGPPAMGAFWESTAAPEIRAAAAALAHIIQDRLSQKHE